MICDVPLRFDTYEGCTHRCSYCFANRKDLHKNKKVVGDFSEKGLIDFVTGKRKKSLSWVDWKLPLHWGGMSDPFQPAEKHFGYSKRALQILADSQYPFVVSTKGKLIASDEYLELLSKCNCVVQISMLCSEFDKVEPGAPTFEERLIMLERVSKVAKRTIVRCQPYMTELLDQVVKNIPRFKKAGAHGVIFEAMKFVKKQPGLQRLGGDYVYPIDTLKAHFAILKQECHKAGLKFYSGENRLRAMGDSLCCCGFSDLDGFTPNTFNANHILLDKTGKSVIETPAMSEPGSGFAAVHAAHQEPGLGYLSEISFKQMVLRELRNKKAYYLKVLTPEGKA